MVHIHAFLPDNQWSSCCRSLHAKGQSERHFNYVQQIIKRHCQHRIPHPELPDLRHALKAMFLVHKSLVCVWSQVINSVYFSFEKVSVGLNLVPSGDTMSLSTEYHLINSRIFTLANICDSITSFYRAHYAPRCAKVY